MRKDMKDIIVNTTRRGKGELDKGFRRGGKGKSKIHGEELPEREKMRYGYGKTLNDRLTPLKRWIDKQVGRPWDKVYSEVCKFADNRNVRGRHLRQHIEWMVIASNKIELVDGKPYEKRGSFGRQYQVSDALYVHPETGLLLKAPKIEYQPKEKEIENFEKDGKTYRKFDGIWYETKERWIDSPYAYFLGKTKKILVIDSKKQLSSKSLKRLNLQNGLDKS